MHTLKLQKMKINQKTKNKKQKTKNKKQKTKNKKQKTKNKKQKTIPSQPTGTGEGSLLFPGDLIGGVGESEEGGSRKPKNPTAPPKEGEGKTL